VRLPSSMTWQTMFEQAGATYGLFDFDKVSRENSRTLNPKQPLPPEPVGARAAAALRDMFDALDRLRFARICERSTSARPESVGAGAAAALHDVADRVEEAAVVGVNHAAHDERAVRSLPRVRVKTACRVSCKVCSTGPVEQTTAVGLSIHSEAGRLSAAAVPWAAFTGRLPSKPGS